MAPRYVLERRLGIGCWLWFRPSASHFLLTRCARPAGQPAAVTSLRFATFARAKEKVTKEKARPTSGFRCAQLPSFRRCSEGRQDGPSLAQHASFGILPNAPLRNTCTRPPDGTFGPHRLAVFCLAWVFQNQKPTLCYDRQINPRPDKRPFSGGRA